MRLTLGWLKGLAVVGFAVTVALAINYAVSDPPVLLGMLIGMAVAVGGCGIALLFGGPKP